MSSSEPEEPIEPLKHYVMGLGLPFFIVFVAVCVAVVVAQITGRDILMAIKWGIGLSLFFSFFGGLQTALGILFIKGRWQNRLWMCFGFLSIWLSLIYVVFNFDFW